MAISCSGRVRLAAVVVLVVLTLGQAKGTEAEPSQSVPEIPRCV